MVSVSPLASLPASFNSNLVSQLVIDPAGNLFAAVSSQDGRTGAYTGIVFELVKAGGGYAPALAPIASFAGRVTSLTSDAAGNLFGTYAKDFSSATSVNAIFEVPKTSAGFGPLTVLADPGAGSSYNIRLDAAGDIIGIATSTYVNPTGYLGGRIFELAKTSTGYAAATTTLYSFATPNASTASLAIDGAGDIFFVAPGSEGPQIQELFKTATGWTAAPVTLLRQSFSSAAFVYNLGGLTIARDGDLLVQGSGAGEYEVVLHLDRTGAGAGGYAAPVVIDSEIAQYGFANALDAPLLDANGDVFLTQPASGLARAPNGAPLPGVIVHVGATAGGYTALDPLAPSSSRAIYAFTSTAGAASPGYAPVSNLVADASGVLYGITTRGGLNGGGAIYQITGSGYGAAPVPAPSAPTLVLPATFDGVVNDSGASSSDRLTNVVRPTITGVAQAGETVTLYDTDGTTVLGTATADAASGAYAIIAATLADGVHQLTAVAALSGATSARSAVLAVTIDTATPTITSLAYGPNDGNLSVGEPITLVYSFSEPVTQTTAPGSDRPAPTLTLSSGATLTALPAGLGTATLTYTYTPAAGQSTPDLAVTGASLNGGPPGFFNDLAGNAVTSSPLGNPPGIVSVGAAGLQGRNYQIVSVTQAGAQGNDDSYGAVFSPNGSSVAFLTNARNFNVNDGNTSLDFYLKDLTSGGLQLVSSDQNGSALGALSSGGFSPDGLLATFFAPIVTRNGFFGTLAIKNLSSKSVSYISDDTNISGFKNAVAAFSSFSEDRLQILISTNALGTPEDTNGVTDVYLGVLADRTLQRVSTTSSGGQIAQGGFNGTFGATSSQVFFGTQGGLGFGPGGPTNFFLKDLASGVTTPVSTNASGALGIGSDNVGQRYAGSLITLDRFAFTSSATNLVSDDLNDAPDVFVKDLATGALLRVSESAIGIDANGASTFLAASQNGREVLFTSLASNLVTGDTNGLEDFFVKDLVTGAIRRFTVEDLTGVADRAVNIDLVVSLDGQTIAFDSAASNLVPNDVNGKRDVFTAAYSVFTPVAAPANTPPSISGAAVFTGATGGVPVTPFTSVVITDPDAGQTETLTIDTGGFGVITGGGFTASGSSLYTVSGSASAVQAALRAASYTPTPGFVGGAALRITVSDGLAQADDNGTVVFVTDAGGGGGGGAPPIEWRSVTAGLLTELQNLTRALANGADAQSPTHPVFAQFEAGKRVIAQYDQGTLTLAQAEAALGHLVDGTTGVAVTSYVFFTGRTTTLNGLNYLVHSPANATDLNDAYYAKFSTENRFINFAVGLGTGAGVGAADFAAGYGSLSLSDAVAKAYQAVFAVAPAPGKIDAILNSAVPDGLGGTETRAQYFAQYGGDGPNGLGTKAAAVGFLLSAAVATSSGVYGVAEAHYVQALAHGVLPALDTEFNLTYGPDVLVVGTPYLDRSIAS